MRVSCNPQRVYNILHKKTFLGIRRPLSDKYLKGDGYTIDIDIPDLSTFKDLSAFKFEFNLNEDITDSYFESNKKDFYHKIQSLVIFKPEKTPDNCPNNGVIFDHGFIGLDENMELDYIRLVLEFRMRENGDQSTKENCMIGVSISTIRDGYVTKEVGIESDMSTRYGEKTELFMKMINTSFNNIGLNRKEFIPEINLMTIVHNWITKDLNYNDKYSAINDTGKLENIISELESIGNTCNAFMNILSKYKNNEITSNTTLLKIRDYSESVLKTHTSDTEIKSLMKILETIFDTELMSNKDLQNKIDILDSDAQYLDTLISNALLDDIYNGYNLFKRDTSFRSKVLRDIHIIILSHRK